jgi:hypothetical protein
MDRTTVSGKHQEDWRRDYVKAGKSKNCRVAMQVKLDEQKKTELRQCCLATTPRNEHASSSMTMLGALVIAQVNVARASIIALIASKTVLVQVHLGSVPIEVVA